jgi:hypothetical protein
MPKTWRCGDCGTEYPKTVHHCDRYFDDYLSLRGGTVESAITRAVDKAIAPLVKQALDRLRPRYTYEIGATVMYPVTYSRPSRPWHAS